MGRALRLSGLLLAFVAAALGAWAVNHPSRPHGPMGFDVLSPLGALALLIGMLILRGLGRGALVYGLAALLIVAVAGRNFFLYPPIPDGAYFLVRYGHAAGGELWPAGATWHVVGFAGAAWALALASEGGPPAKGWGAGSEAALLASLTAVGAAALESFTQMLPGAAGPWPRMALWLAGLTAATVAAWLARRNRLARLAAVFLSLLTLLAAATLALYQFG